MVLPGREELTLSLKPAMGVWPREGLPVQFPRISRGGESLVGPGPAEPAPQEVPLRGLYL